MSGRLRGAVELGVFGGVGLALSALEQSPLLPHGLEPLRGHLSDFFGPSAYVGLQRVLSGNNLFPSVRAQALYGFLTCSAAEVSQIFIHWGTFDPKDFFAYAAGVSVIYAKEFLRPSTPDGLRRRHASQINEIDYL